MSELDDRIARFEHMARADPDNEMAHFSLGSAYLQAGRAAEAAASFQRCTALNPDMSKAWQMAGEALIKAGWSDKAVEVLNKGYEIAASKGDRMPQQAMADLLRSIGREPPPPRAPATAAGTTKGAGGAGGCGVGVHLSPHRPPRHATPGAAVPGPDRKVDSREHLRRDLAGLDRSGHQGHQRTAAGFLAR